MNRELRQWYLDENLRGACNHESRLHRRDDLSRYLYVSCFGLAHGRSPKLRDFPADLLPDHKNAWEARRTHELFDDRFRVQLAHEPATTVTSHICKDGHYYIHHDPSQCRSWTVREAAPKRNPGVKGGIFSDDGIPGIPCLARTFQVLSSRHLPSI